MSSGASAGDSPAGGNANPSISGRDKPDRIFDFDAVLNDRGSRPADRYLRPRSRSRDRPPIRHDGSDSDDSFSDESPADPAMRRLSEPPTSRFAPHVSSTISDTDFERSDNPFAKDDRKEYGAYLLQRGEDEFRRHQERLTRNKELRKRQEEYLNRKEQLAKRQERSFHRRKELLKRQEEFSNRKERLLKGKGKLDDNEKEPLKREGELLSRKEELVQLYGQLNIEEQLMKDEEEHLNREEELLKRDEEHLSLEKVLLEVEDHTGEGASRISPFSGVAPEHYQYDMSLGDRYREAPHPRQYSSYPPLPTQPGHNYHGVPTFKELPPYRPLNMPLDSYHQGSPPRLHPAHPPPAMPLAYVPESGIARSRPTGIQPGMTYFSERFVDVHARGSHQAIKCTLRMTDVFGEFSESELDGDPFWDLVVLIGDPSNEIDGGPWTTTCRDYVANTWPHSAAKIKDVFMLLGANSGTADTKKTLTTMSSGDVLVSTSRHLSMDGDRVLERELSVSFDGRAESQADMVEALTWLFAVLQSRQDVDGPIASGIEWSRGSRGRAQARNSIYALSNDLLEPLKVPYYSACWTPLLPRTACAVDFGARQRPREMQGLEISFELMCFLSGLEYEVIEDEGLVLYGQRSMVYPVQAAADCVQWHFQPYDPNRPLHSQITGKRMLVDDLDTLREAKRHFLGLWPDPRIILGTEGVDDTKIGWSAAEEVRRETIRDGSSFGGAVSLPKVLVLNWSQTFKVARSRKNQYMANFEANLHRMINSPVVLYSPSEKRAWMVSFVSVLLHLARARASFQKSLGFHVPPCERRGNGGQAAFECLRANRGKPLKRPAENETLSAEEQTFTVENYVNEVLAAMECARRESCRAKGILRQVKERIIGFELADIARMKPTMRMKQRSLDAFAISGWAPLLDEVQLTFFYEGLPDPILPSETSPFPGACGNSSWRTIPKGFNLLAVSLPCLVHLAEDRNGGSRTLQRLTHEFSWHCPGEVYRMCDRQIPHACCRLQELAPRGRAKSPDIPIFDAEETGAVVFRYADGFRTIVDSMNGEVRDTTHGSENEIPSELDGQLAAHERLSPRRRLITPSSWDSGYSSGGNPDASGSSLQSSSVVEPPGQESRPEQPRKGDEGGATRPDQLEPPKRSHRRRHKTGNNKESSNQSLHPAPGGSKPKRSEKVRIGFL